MLVCLKGHCCLVGSLLGQFLDFEDSLALGVGFGLDGLFTLDLQGDFGLFHCLARVCFQGNGILLDLLGFMQLLVP